MPFKVVSTKGKHLHSHGFFPILFSNLSTKIELLNVNVNKIAWKGVLTLFVSMFNLKKAARIILENERIQKRLEAVCVYISIVHYLHFNVHYLAISVTSDKYRTPVLPNTLCLTVMNYISLCFLFCPKDIQTSELNCNYDTLRDTIQNVIKTPQRLRKSQEQPPGGWKFPALTKHVVCV